MVQATDAPKDAAHRGMASITRTGLRRVAENRQFVSIDMQCIACAQHRNPTHGSTVDVEATRTIVHMHPHPAAVNRQLRQPAVATRVERRYARVIASHGVHPRTEWQVGPIGVGES